jgi:hypothetical protein
MQGLLIFHREKLPTPLHQYFYGTPYVWRSSFHWDLLQMNSPHKLGEVEVTLHHC